VIDQFSQAVEAFLPEIGEGFAAVRTVPFRDGQFDFEAIASAIEKLPQSIQHQKNRISQYQLHPYSDLLAFERLMYLISALMQFPGLGNWQQHHPTWLQRELGQSCLPNFPSAAAEIAAVMERKYGVVYGDQEAIAHNLDWLQTNHFINTPFSAAPLQFESDLVSLVDRPNLLTHRYSDRTPFDRLMQLIRFLAHHPQLYQSHKNVRSSLLDGLKQQGIVPVQSKQADSTLQNNLRKDIETGLKPYGIMTSKPMRNGYFVGTGILSAPELLQVYYGLESQAKHLSDPVALKAYEIFRDRLTYLNLEPHEMYPVRQVLSQQIVAPELLSSTALGHERNLAQLEDAIQMGQTVWIRHLNQAAEFEQDTQKTTAYEVLPLQIVFYSIAWYMGYERQDNQLLEYYRLDRLTLEPNSSRLQRHSREKQTQLRQRLERLQVAGYGVYLGRDPAQQSAFLSADAKVQKSMMDVLELWFDTRMFRFVSEGTNRFADLQMSPRLTAMSVQERQQVFKLKISSDANYPHRLRAKLPVWTLRESVDLRTWIIGFGNSVKVISPGFLATEIAERGRAIAALYSNESQSHVSCE
jgi:WYL domain